MPLNPAPITVKDGAAADKSLIAYSDGTSSAFAQPLLDPTGAIISPATAGNQASANAKLDAIAANTGVGGIQLFSALTLTANSLYTTGKILGGKLSFTAAARFNGGSGVIRQAVVAKKANLSAIVDLFVFNADPAGTYANGQDLPNLGTELGKLAGVIRCSEQVDAGACTLMLAQQQDLLFKIAAANTTLIVVPVLRGSETYPATDTVLVGLGILQH
jgi:hypothetical protein